MLANNTTENIFQFLQLRPARLVDSDDGVDILPETRFAKEMSGAKPSERVHIAHRFLQESERVKEIVESEDGRRILTAIRSVLTKDGTVEQFRSAVGEVKDAGGTDQKDLDKLRATREAASDLLIAAKFANNAPRGLRAVEQIFRGLSALLSVSPKFGGQVKLKEYLRRPLALPDAFRPVISRSYGRTQKTTQPGESSGKEKEAGDALAEAGRVHRALEELEALARPEFLRLPGDTEGEGKQPNKEKAPFALSDRGISRLSPETRKVLEDLNLNVATQSINSLIDALETEVAIRAYRMVKGVRVSAPQDFGVDEQRPYLRDVGVADLLVVRQHLKKYERVDIAHIENVLIGEKKSRNHRALERTEETFTTEKETIHERETELETAERFELNREAAKTVQRDQQFGFGLTVSGKYGPTVEFSSNLQANVSTSTEESTRNATTYAKDVIERSLERVIERVREEQVRRVIREQEETNLHELENNTDRHISGVYQFLEKVYESQIFNYGIRQMFDFMVPEPASYLWHLEQSETELNLPTPPPKLERFVPHAGLINELNYLKLAAQFGADGIEPPPTSYLTTSTSVTHGENANDESEQGKPRSVLNKELPVPPGYRPFLALMRPLALTDDRLTLGITVGHTRRVWVPNPESELVSVGDGHRIGTAPLILSLLTDSYLYEENSKLPLQVLAFETYTYGLTVEVLFQRTFAAYGTWQIKTYDKLAAASRENFQKYELKVQELKAAAEAEAARTTTRFGAPPSQNLKTIKAELKKHCISIVTRQRYDAFDAVRDDDPPYFDFIEAATEGSFIRFFEQAFEWDQMQYVFYPYFWGRKSIWAERFQRQDVDPNFLEFLQAGAARVVVPVRLGFEVALTHYLETGEIWNGEGEPPVIHSPLYVPIITEIRERTDAPQGEIPVGDPWPTRLPTPLVILRSEDNLPEWERLDPTGWEWQEVNAG